VCRYVNMEMFAKDATDLQNLPFFSMLELIGFTNYCTCIM
jgi:hypothetical protein